MRFLLTSIGSHGDINPFLALGRELTRRGHEAVFLANPHFEADARAAGLDFEPFGEPLDPVRVARDQPLAFNRVLGAWVVFRRWMAPIVPVFVERLRAVARARRPDALVGHQISLGLPWVARETGLPFATCVLAPATMNSREDPSVMPVGLDPTHRARWFRRMHAAILRASAAVMVDGALNVHRRALGLPPRRDTFWGEMFEGSLSLGLWSPTFRPRAADDPPNFHVCGFPWHDQSAVRGEAGRRLDARLARFLDAGDAPVIFTLGSILAHDARREFEVAAEACRMLGVRGVLVTGSAASAPARLPPGVIAVEYAPYGELLPRAAAIVHHGGIGTTGQSLRAGRPVIVIPFAHDQFDNAARCQRLGVGVRLPRWRASARGLARTLRAVLDDRAMRARAAEIADAVRAENGAAAAADLLERLPQGVTGRVAAATDPWRL